MKNYESPHMSLTLALCGLGAAGRARLSAAQTLDGITLAGIISRRSDIATLSLEAALSDPQIKAIAISTENTDHPQKVRTCLEAGKHVLCDYPLAFSGAEAKELFALARAKNRILHVEHIALLTEQHRDVLVQIATLGPLKHGRYHFTANLSEKMADQNLSGPRPILALSRLLQIADWFGDFKITQKNIEDTKQGILIQLTLIFKDGGVLDFTEEHRPGLTRGRSLVAMCERGPIQTATGTMGGGLFAKDLACFRDRVLGVGECYYDEEKMVRVLEEMFGR